MTENFTKDKLNRAVLVGLSAHSLTREENATEESMEELKDLLETAGGESVGMVLQQKDSPDPRTFIGQGKVDEVRQLVRTMGADMVIFDNALSPSQQRVLGQELPGPDEELGYALRPDFWGRGLMTEAARELIRWGFEELGMSTIWCNHYDGNERSHRVIEKCGFQYQFSQEEQVELLNECRLTHFYALSRADWENRRAVML